MAETASQILNFMQACPAPSIHRQLHYQQRAEDALQIFRPPTTSNTDFRRRQQYTKDVHRMYPERERSAKRANTSQHLSAEVNTFKHTQQQCPNFFFYHIYLARVSRLMPKGFGFCASARPAQTETSTSLQSASIYC